MRENTPKWKGLSSSHMTPGRDISPDERAARPALKSGPRHLAQSRFTDRFRQRRATFPADSKPKSPALSQARTLLWTL